MYCTEWCHREENKNTMYYVDSQLSIFGLFWRVQSESQNKSKRDEKGSMTSPSADSNRFKCFALRMH